MRTTFDSTSTDPAGRAGHGARRFVTGVVSAGAVIAAAATAASSVSASTEPADNDATRVIETVYGPVEVPSEPQRIVTTSYDGPRQLQAVGVMPIAAIDFSAWGDSFTDEQMDFIADADVIGTFGEPNLEAIAAVEPDLILGDSYEIDESVYELLSEIAPTVIVGSDQRGDWKLTSTMTADAVGATDALGELIETYDSTIARLQATYPDQLALGWAHFSLGDENGFTVQYPTGSTGNLIFNDLGATLAASLPDVQPESGFESFSNEQIVDVLGGADVLVHFRNPDGGVLPVIQDVIDQPLFASLPAADAGHVFGLCCQVSDDATATDYLLDIEEAVLIPLADEAG